MKVASGVVVVTVVVMVVVVHGEDEVVVRYDTPDQHHFQNGKAGKHVTGVYGWTSPEGYHFLVRYIADLEGYRVTESNAVPVNAAGTLADGRQRAPLHGHAHVPGDLPDEDTGGP
ncbi:uncharacterized protein LOC123506250 [Portunus trituberculatus]|uniref:uncharacterized protein LOC123506250 n=1 Tax=Portunus trituberculatus TaxID=210409 RepID=UPI001E1CC660|nr:uncharacterized protein LOC123506250 [Portunus trituberculatus]